MSAPVHQMKSSSRRKATARSRKRASRARPGMFAVWEDTTKGGAFYEGDPYTCRRCPDAKMNADCTACAEGYTLVGDSTMGPQSCIKTLHVTEAEEAFGLLSEATSLKVLNLQTGEPHPRNKKEDSADGTADLTDVGVMRHLYLNASTCDAYITTALLQQIGPANPWPICVSCVLQIRTPSLQGLLGRRDGP